MDVFTKGDKAKFNHPAGPVEGTITETNARATCLHILRHGGLPPIDIWFTLRTDGTFRQTGKGSKSPKLEHVK